MDEDILKLLEQQEFYKEFINYENDYNKILNEKLGKNHSNYLVSEILANAEIRKEPYINLVGPTIDFLRKEVIYFGKKIKFLESLKSENNQDRIEINIKQSKARHKRSKELLYEFIDLNGELSNSNKNIDDELNKIEGENSVESILNKIKDFSDELKNYSLYQSNNKEDKYLEENNNQGPFDSLINSNANSELADWYKFLRNVYMEPNRDNILNKNVICNLKIIFKNPVTGLYTDKEEVVNFQYSTSQKTSPVFGLGRTKYVAVNKGVKILVGSMVTLALENVALSHLHAISLADHYSVTDLPALDMYIIPIEPLNNGEYDILLFKGIKFLDKKQNDNASSTGVYYAFNFFAEDVYPMNSAEIKDKFILSKRGNTNLQRSDYNVSKQESNK